MRVPLSWLREFVDVEEPAEILAERLPMLGVGVDGMEIRGDDAIFDLEIASNRPDLLGLVGVARELAAWTRRDVRYPPDEVVEHDPAASSMASVEIVDAVLSPRYVAWLITGVAVRPSPAWIAGRLEAAGIRPINNVVDATNYAMIEWGQPMHAFDLDTIGGRRIVVRPARPDERLVTLDGQDRALDEQTLVIADATRAVALAGIMGGAETEIGPQTATVLLEAASFSPASVRRTSRRLGLRTEASARFERGVDPDVAMRAARRCAALIADVSGGRVLGGPIDVYPSPVSRGAIPLRLTRIERLLGIAVPGHDVLAILSRLGLDARLEGDVVHAIPPVGRRDLEREEDLIEEVARHHGYERIPERLPVETLQQGRRARSLELEDGARDVLIRAGLTEAMTLSLVHPRLVERLVGEDRTAREALVGVQNPLTADHTHLRPALLPGVLEAVRTNVSRRREAVHLFEIGRVFARGPDGSPLERKSVAIAMRGAWLQGLWDGVTGREATFSTLRGVLDMLVDHLRSGTMTVRSGGPAWLHPGRSAEVRLNGEVLGVAGELHPDAAARFDLTGRTLVAELDLERLLDRADLRPRFSGLPRYPAVQRDIAVVAPIDLPQADVEAALREAAGHLLERVELFDAYTGPPLDPGTRNLAYALTLRAQDRTLTGEEVDTLITEIHRVLPERLKVTIRT